MGNISIKDVQNIQKNMLIELIKYFEENDLKYFVIGGTLLGAVRHRGFIPWDDDIDLGMPREDYNRLIELSQIKPINKNYRLSCIKTDKIEYPFIKIFNKDYCVREETKYKINNLWIDIFPFEGVPNDIDVQKKMYEKIMKYKKKINFRMMDNKCVKDSTPSTIKRIIKIIIKPFVNLLPIDYYAKKMNKYASKISPKEYIFVGDIVWGSQICDTFKKEELDNLIDLEFENIKVKSIPHYDDFLTRCYGDYMKLPPESDRKIHMIDVWRVNNEKDI